MAAKYPSDQSIQIKINDLHIDSGKADTESTDGILNMCVKCSNYVMANQFNILSILSNHKCVVRCPATTAENFNTCMHKTIDAISNHDTSSEDLLGRYRSQPILTPPVSLLDMSSIVSFSNEIEMKDSVHFDMPGCFMTSTPKVDLPTKKDERGNEDILSVCFACGYYMRGSNIAKFMEDHICCATILKIQRLSECLHIMVETVMKHGKGSEKSAEDA